MVQNVRIIWWGQLKVITDIYLLVGAIKSWRAENASFIIRTICHGGQIDNTVLIPSSRYAKNYLHLPQTCLKNLKMVSGWWMKLYTDVCSHFWLPTSADIFVAPPVSKLSSVSVYPPQSSLPSSSQHANPG